MQLYTAVQKPWFCVRPPLWIGMSSTVYFLIPFPTDSISKYRQEDFAISRHSPNWLWDSASFVEAILLYLL